jgi:putative ABC transport system permease protein
MSWIAVKMLVGDRAKFYGIVMGLTFAALLITQQGSIFCGLMLRTAGQVTDITGADLWVMDPNVRFIDDVKPMIENNLYRVRGVEGVLWAVPLYKGNARAKLNSTGHDGTRHEVIEQIILLGLDDTSMVGAPPPERILEGDLINLRKPEAVMVDSTRLQKLYPGEDWKLLEENGKPLAELPAEVRDRFIASYGSIPAGPDGRVNFFKVFIGRDLEMNDRRAVIVAVCEATRTFQSNAVFYTTYSRAKQYAPQERKVLSYILAKTEPGLAPEAVAKRITEQTDLGAKTSDEFTWMTIDYYLKYTGIPINFGITAVLGFLVGTAIAGQTFYNFTLENLRQFGALKAMGATNFTIVRMILLQATIVGLLGYGIGVGAASLFGARSKGTELAFYTPWQLLPITGVAVVFICMLASILSVRRVIVLEPAVVFRG